MTGRHRAKRDTTDPAERLDGNIKRRNEVIWIFSNKADVIRLIGSLLLGQRDERAGQRARDMSLETIAALSNGLAASLPPMAD